MNEMIFEMNHILNCGYEIKWSYDPRSYEHNLAITDKVSSRRFGVIVAPLSRQSE